MTKSPFPHHPNKQEKLTEEPQLERSQLHFLSSDPLKGVKILQYSMSDQVFMHTECLKFSAAVANTVCYSVGFMRFSEKLENRFFDCSYCEPICPISSLPHQRCTNAPSQCEMFDFVWQFGKIYDQF